MSVGPSGPDAGRHEQRGHVDEHGQLLPDGVGGEGPRGITCGDGLAELGRGENGSRVRAAARAAVSEHRRARSQRAQLARLRRRVDPPVRALPFLFEPDLGVEAARQLARKLG